MLDIRHGINTYEVVGTQKDSGGMKATLKGL